MERYSSAAPYANKYRKDGSPQRVLAKSYPPPQKIRREIGISTNVRLTELMDEDEARWMSGAESSRSPTPTQGMKKSQAGKNETSTSDTHAEIGVSRNTTPPLPPLAPARFAATYDAEQVERSNSMTGLTALPRCRDMTARPTTFAQRVFSAGKSDLLYDVIERHRMPWHFETKKHGVLDISTLQKMQQHVLQQKLVEQAKVLGQKGAWQEIDIGSTIREYCQLIRDLELMQKYASQGNQDDPFLISTSRLMETRLLEDAGFTKHSQPDRQNSFRIERLDRGSVCIRILRRLFVFALTAVSLVLPFLIGVLTPGYLGRVVLACVCILLFSLATMLLRGPKGSLIPCVALVLVYGGALIIFVGSDPLHYGDVR